MQFSNTQGSHGKNEEQQGPMLCLDYATTNLEVDEEDIDPQSSN